MEAVRTRVKVCGITTADDARAAVAAGADALGVILAPSKREVTIEEAADILSAASGSSVARVGVFVDAPEGFVREAVARLGLTVVQLHGRESPTFCASMPVPVVKTMRVGDGFDPAAIEPYKGSIAAVLLDTLVAGVDGGSGRAFAWELVPRMPAWAPVMVAGGLTPVNVGSAIRALHPLAVDVSTGVEERVRHKDRMKLNAFVAAVRAADALEGR
jgi:phosphoribosylanthranilate isomerase